MSTKQQHVEIKMERRVNGEGATEGDGVVIAISRDVMEFCLTHVGLLHVTTGDIGQVIIHEDGRERRLDWAEITTEMPPPE